MTVISLANIPPIYAVINPCENGSFFIISDSPAYNLNSFTFRFVKKLIFVSTCAASIFASF